MNRTWFGFEQETWLTDLIRSRYFRWLPLVVRYVTTTLILRRQNTLATCLREKEPGIVQDLGRYDISIS